MISLCKFLRSVINVEDKLGERLIRILPSPHNSFFQLLLAIFCNSLPFTFLINFNVSTLFFTLALRITLRFLQSVVGN